MKHLLFVLCAAMLLTSPVYAETICGVDITIPDTWTLTKSDLSDEENVAINIYKASDDEYVSIVVQDTSYLSDDMYNIADLFLLDCNDQFGNNNGYYLMTDAETKENDMLSKMQECVFQDSEGQWEYVFLGARNHGKYAISLIYQSFTSSLRLGFIDFILLYNDFVAE